LPRHYFCLPSQLPLIQHFTCLGILTPPCLDIHTLSKYPYTCLGILTPPVSISTPCLDIPTLVWDPYVCLSILPLVLVSLHLFGSLYLFGYTYTCMIPYIYLATTSLHLSGYPYTLLVPYIYLGTTFVRVFQYCKVRIPTHF
jgi:hypothetical protein